MLSVWDKQMACMQFKWWWLHTPTYAAYTVEGIHVPLLLAATGAVKSVRSAALVLSSLTPNAQSVFQCLADFQIAHPDDQGTNYRTGFTYEICFQIFKGSVTFVAYTLSISCTKLWYTSHSGDESSKELSNLE
jgi:origin recognition complex subunit 2